MTEHADDRTVVSEHYGRGDLAARILAALRAAGKVPDALAADDLAPVDQFHTRGKDATLELARLAGVTPEMRVLDVGGGLGGPARTLASEIGCSVEVLDVTEEFCRAGEMLTTRTGLGDLVSFRHASALDMPHSDASFDAVWMQHSSMNIADKERLFAEIQRVLRPGGHLALHEIMAGPVAPIYFPVPWARGPEINFLRPPEEVRALITGTGFEELAWMDETASALRWFRERLAAADAASGELPPLGLHLVLGADLGQMFRNLARNLQEDRAVVVQGVFERP
ncbi:MAG: methyltransferase domain-containing protein [Actinobacteria bacterium]|nr:methyltransferase domain-containing protein [Actinomycetota bacterium]